MAEDLLNNPGRIERLACEFGNVTTWHRARSMQQYVPRRVVLEARRMKLVNECVADARERAGVSKRGQALCGGVASRALFDWPPAMQLKEDLRIARLGMRARDRA